MREYSGFHCNALYRYRTMYRTNVSCIALIASPFSDSLACTEKDRPNEKGRQNDTRILIEPFPKADGAVRTKYENMISSIYVTVDTLPVDGATQRKCPIVVRVAESRQESRMPDRTPDFH